jgi:hypothetical protein
MVNLKSICAMRRAIPKDGQGHPHVPGMMWFPLSQGFYLDCFVHTVDGFYQVLTAQNP